jgi:hypothetical protein
MGRPMNALVLAIAGVLVGVGIALIVLSIVLARKQPAPEEPPSDLPEPATDAGVAFIDLPLQTDMSAALGHTAPEPADDDPTEETTVVELQTQDDTGGNARPDKED